MKIKYDKKLIQRKKFLTIEIARKNSYVAYAQNILACLNVNSMYLCTAYLLLSMQHYGY